MHLSLHRFVKITLTLSSNKPTSLSQASSILWGDCEVVLVLAKGNWYIRHEEAVCLCEITTVGIGHGCWVVLVSHIGDVHIVPDIREKREWSTP